MLKDIDYKNFDFGVEEPKLTEVVKAIEEAIQIHGKVVVKIKNIKKGKFVNIYAYDKSLYRSIIVNTIQIE